MKFQLQKNSHYFTPRIFLDIFFLLFPILPSFCRVLGRTIGEWITLFAFAIFLIFFHPRFKKQFLVLIVLDFLLFFFDYLVHNELLSSITILINCFIPIIIGFSYTSSKAKFSKLLTILVLGGFIVCIEGIIEFLSGFNLFSLLQTIPANEAMGAKILGYRYGHVRIEGPFGQPFPFAMYMLFIHGITMILLFLVKKPLSKKAFLIMMLILSFVCIYLSTVRSIFILCLLLDFCFLFKLTSINKWLFFLGIVFGLIISYAVEPGLISDTFYSFLSLFDKSFYSKLSDGGQNIIYRQILLNAGFSYIKGHLMMGVGYDAAQEFTFYASTPTSNWLASSIDNGYLYIIISYGFFGLLAVFIMPFVLCFSSVRLIKNGGESKQIPILVLLLLILYFADLIWVSQLDEKKIFYLLIGSVFGYYNLLKFNGATKKRFVSKEFPNKSNTPYVLGNML